MPLELKKHASLTTLETPEEPYSIVIKKLHTFKIEGENEGGGGEKRTQIPRYY